MSKKPEPLTAEEEANWRKIRKENPKLVSAAICEERLFATLDRERERYKSLQTDYEALLNDFDQITTLDQER